MRFLPLLRPFALLSMVFTSLAAAQPNPPTSGALPAEQLAVAPGFKVELLRSAAKEEGSWICMAIDGKGRLYISAQGKPEGAGFRKTDPWGGLFRVTLDASGQVSAWEKVPLPIGDAMGMLWAFDSLYVSGDGPEGRGIYRLKDSAGRDQLDSFSLFHKVQGGAGEHGAHALVLAPDGKSIYIVHGNSTPLIDSIDTASPFRNYGEDDLLPRIKDPVATFFDKLKSPYGYVLKTDENGTRWDLVAAGFRNPYDIDFSPEGELFTYDSDMEWDVGLPWYRPTRVLHIVTGAEFGFREGCSKWPAYYADSLPSAVDIGLGCPTGVKFGTKSNFPEKYRRSFFILDWTFGRILAVHLKPNGASFTAQSGVPSAWHLTGPVSSPDVEEFVRGKGLPVTDVEFGNDGAMYFTIGGRGTQAGLYRVSWTGEPSKGPLAPLPHTRPTFAENSTIDQIWPSLGAADRFVRFEARRALELIPVESWRQKATSEKDARTALHALLALARVGTKDDQAPLLTATAAFPLSSLGDEVQLEKLRVLEVALARHGRPNTESIQALIRELSAAYPAKNFSMNRELCALLCWLTQQEPGVSATAAQPVIDKTLALMDDAKDPAEVIWYALCLRQAEGWTPLQREHYFSWFAKLRSVRGGNSAKKFVLKIRDEALEKVSATERPAYLALAEKEIAKPAPAAPTAMRPFVKAWTVADLAPALDGASHGRNFANGQKLYRELMCAQCHLFAGQGGDAKAGAVGPDLTAVGSRFSPKDILEAIIDPSKAISEQYASFIFTMKDGSMTSGQIAEENHYLLTLVVDPISGARQNFNRGNVVKREMSPVSLMPPGLLYSCSQEDVLDLLAFLQSGGNATAPNFKK